MGTAQIGPDLRLSESFFFFHKHGVMGSSFNVVTQSLAVLGQPIQNFTETLLRHILEDQELLRALVLASQPLERHSGFATGTFGLLIPTFFPLILSRLIESQEKITDSHFWIYLGI